MEILIGLAIGLGSAAVVVLTLLKKGTSDRSVQPLAPAITASEIREVIREVHGETLRDLSEQARVDREDAINTASREMGDAIDHTKKEIAETVGRLEAEVEKLREDNSTKFGNVDSAVGNHAE